MTSSWGVGRLFHSPIPAAPGRPDSPVPSTLESNLSETLGTITAEARRSGRQAEAVSLLAVTKSVGPRTAMDLARLGQRDLGENRLPSLLEKRAEFDRAGLKVIWHFIGQIQRNKARKVIQNSEVLHSVDTLRLIETLNRVASEEHRRVSIYLEVKLSDEETKHGFKPEELDEAVEKAGEADSLDLLGLMTMAPLPDPRQEKSARTVFETLARLAREMEQDPYTSSRFKENRVQLSMGMSGDFVDAIAAGSDVVRIGSALFAGINTDTPTPGVAS